MRTSAERLGRTVALLAALLALSGCGLEGDDEGGEAVATTASPLEEEGWTARADRFCTDGTQEATALPLPTRSPEIAADTAARAEILATVRDGLLTLGRPDDVDEVDLNVFLAELDADIEQLSGPATATSADGLSMALDESAGQAANELGLPGCAALSNAIARTP